MIVLLLAIAFFLIVMILLNFPAFIYAFKNNGIWGLFRMFIAVFVHTFTKPLTKK